MATLSDNRKARWRYEILETWEVGVALSGQEVKSIKGGRCDLHSSYVTVRSAHRAGHRRARFEASLINCYIPKYERAGPLPGYEPRRSRRLLMKRAELERLVGQLQTKGLTLVPLKVYTRNHLVKLQIGLARGKTKIDKRETIKEREVKRNLRQRSLQRH
jgi:SsrA-binding protein